jgi:hypothetical protein
MLELPSITIIALSFFAEFLLALGAGAAAGAVGSSVLHKTSGREYISVVHAAIAGLLGSAIINGSLTMLRLAQTVIGYIFLKKLVSEGTAKTA